MQEGKESGQKTPRYQTLAILTYLLFAIGPLVGNAVLVLQGEIASDYGVDATLVLTAIPAFMLPFALVQLFSGAMSDIYGRIRLIIPGSIVFAAGLIMMVTATTIDVFIWGNVLSGIGFGFVNPVVLALLSDLSTPEEIPRRMGIASALASLGAGLGPFFAGLLIAFGWGFYYLIFFIVDIVSLIVISRVKHPSDASPGKSQFHKFIVNLASELKKSVVILMLGATFLVSLIYLGALVWTSRALTGKLSENIIGLLLLGAGIAGATAGSQLGRMIRHWGYGRPILIGIMCNFVGLLILILMGDITQTAAIPFLAVALVAIGWAGGLLFPMSISFSQLISPERRGVLAGVVTSSFFFGSAFILNVYEPLYNISIQAVYLEMVAIAIILGFLFYILNRNVSPLTVHANINHGDL